MIETMIFVFIEASYTLSVGQTCKGIQKGLLSALQDSGVQSQSRMLAKVTIADIVYQMNVSKIFIIDISDNTVLFAKNDVINDSMNESYLLFVISMRLWGC